MKKEVKTEKAPKALGPYSQAIIAEGTAFYISGQLPIDPDTNEFPSDNLKEQTKQSLENIKMM
ncbi:Rid family hydrolase, partial [Paenibacillus antibioticophila]|uniref:Rid family hydrolase n=1 Tax=Paenibacillus antibioticophila TaxID=1274374 RepID=UPI0005C9C7B4